MAKPLTSDATTAKPSRRHPPAPLDRGVQRQEIGLRRDRVDQVSDLADPVGGVGRPATVAFVRSACAANARAIARDSETCRDDVLDRRRQLLRRGGNRFHIGRIDDGSGGSHDGGQGGSGVGRLRRAGQDREPICPGGGQSQGG